MTITIRCCAASTSLRRTRPVFSSRDFSLAASAAGIDARNLADYRQQFGQVRRLFEIVPVAIDDLAQQRDISRPFGHEHSSLVDDLGEWTAGLAAATIRHDAVGAAAVAAVHHGQPPARSRAVGRGRWRDRPLRLSAGSLQPRVDFRQEVREETGAKELVDVRETSLEGGQRVQTDHAAADRYDGVRT